MASGKECYVCKEKQALNKDIKLRYLFLKQKWVCNKCDTLKIKLK